MVHVSTRSIFSKFLLVGLLFFTSSYVYSAEYCLDQYYIEATLPNEAKWDLCWEHRNREGIVFHHVFYTPKNGVRQQVLYNAAIAQIHVPYDDNRARYHDVSDYGLGGRYMQNLSSQECQNGTLKTFSGKNVLCQQIETRHIAHHADSDKLHGDALSLLSVTKVGAYNYLPQWRFFDDGTIQPSMGATGALQRHSSGNTNRGWQMDSNRTGIAHLHNFFWRLDFDLGDSGTDDYVEELNFPLISGKRVRSETRFSSEKAREVMPSNLRSWRIVDGNSSNGNGHKKSYEVLLTESGHKDKGPSNEPYTHNDFFVTKANSCEKFASHNPTTNGCKKNLAEFVNGESISGKDIIVWVGLTFYHMPRVEDAPHMDAHWNQFEIIPRDWHANNPIGVVAPPVNQAPSITSPGNQTNTVGDVVNLALSAQDPDSTELSYSSTNLPAGLIVNNSTGVITGTITSAAVGTQNVSVTVDDGQLNDSVSFSWNVRSINQAPSIISPGNQTNTVGDVVNLALSAQDPDSTELSYSSTNLPSGLSINNLTGVITGTITSAAVGTQNVSVTVDDGLLNDSISFSWNVNPDNPTSNGIQIDGNDTDWAQINLFLDTPNENLSPVDFEKAAVTGDENKVYVAYYGRQTIDQNTSWAWQVLIDSDYQSNTGLKYFDMGGDYLLSGNDLYKYAGDGISWEWALIEPAEIKVNGKFVEFALDRSTVGSSNQMKLTFYGANSYAGGVTDDFFAVIQPNVNGETNVDVVQIDGNNADWASINFVSDDSNENLSPVDFEKAAVTGDENKVYVAYYDRQIINQSISWAWQVLIDSDYQRDTGLKYLDIGGGSDYLVLGRDLYKYAGNGTSWEWTLIGPAEINMNGKFVEFSLDRSIVGSSNQMKLSFFGANSYAGGVTNDFFVVNQPNINGEAIDGILIDGNSNDWAPGEAILDEVEADTFPVDYQSVWFKQDNQKAYFAYNNRINIDLEKYWAWIVLIDTDKQINTGLNFYGKVGADFLLLGNNLYKYAGTGDDWSWTLIRQVSSAVNGKFAELAVDKSDLNNSNDYNLIYFGSNTYAGGVVDDSVDVLQ